MPPVLKTMSHARRVAIAFLSAGVAACGGESGGSSPTTADGAAAPAAAPAPAPAPSITTDLGKPGRLLVGLGAANTFEDMKAQQITPDIIDTYLVAVTGFNSGGGGNAWPQWQYGYPDGGVVTVFSDGVAAMGAVPMFTLFQMPSLRGGDVTVINDAPFMAAYWSQVKLMYQKIAETNRPTLVNLEPDFWGFAEGSAPGGDPTKLPARVSTVPECASQPDTAVGVVGCLLKLGRTYAPKARMGFPPSMWYGNPDATGTFMAKLGADKADFIVAQTSDRDAGCFEVPVPVDECAGRGTGPFYLDENNVTTPNFNQGLNDWSTVRSHLGGLPILFWQTPMGVPSTTPGGTPKHYRDNHVQYMLTHPTQYTGNGVFALVFSPGGATSADITNDGGQFARLSKAYFANPAPFPR